jgi:hypothetical protein
MKRISEIIAPERITKPSPTSAEQPLKKIVDVTAKEARTVTDSELENQSDRWSQADFTVIGLAVLVGTLLDVFVVRIPKNTTILGKLEKGSPLTGWMREHSAKLAKLLKPLEKFAKVPFDAPHHPLVDGLHAKVHRLMSPGHDLFFGFVYGLRDLMLGQGTFIDKFGKVQVVKNITEPLGAIESLIKLLAHFLSDAFTKMGLPTPLTTALQFVKGKSPFILRPGGSQVEWHHVARYMYANGFDLRHLITQGITPASVQLIIRGYVLLLEFVTSNEEYPSKASREKIEGMIAVANTLVMGGNLIKVGVMKSPLAINQAQVLATLGSLITVGLEQVKRVEKKRRLKTKTISELQPLEPTIA